MSRAVGKGCCLLGVRGNEPGPGEASRKSQMASRESLWEVPPSERKGLRVGGWRMSH